jgi:hypothetical protein
MATPEKYWSLPIGGSGLDLKQTFAHYASKQKRFEDLPEVLQLKVFDKARLTACHVENGGGDLRTTAMIWAVSKSFKKVIDLADGLNLKQTYAQLASKSKGFDDLPEILQLKILDMARMPGPPIVTWEEDLRTPIVLRAFSKRFKRMTDSADDPTYHPNWSYYVDAQLRDIGGPNEIVFGSAWRAFGWTIESLKDEAFAWAVEREWKESEET